MSNVETTPTTEDPKVLVRLSSTIVVEDAPYGIRLVRGHYRTPALITLRPEVEDALLAFLLARKGITLAPAS